MNALPRAFVAGWPVAHSRSPLIHRYWLNLHGIAGDYVRQPVSPEAAPDFFRSLADHGFVGGNVTLPHKEAAYAACDRRTEVAERLKAVNTLWLEDGNLCGDNTDVHGFAANLDQHSPGWRLGRHALVLGAGGAARAVVRALLDAGFRETVVINRTESRAGDLARHFGPAVRSGSLETIPDVLPRADLIVNTTSAGMKGEGDLVIDWSMANPEAIATDIVYVPLQTPFLAGASLHGLRTADGLGMLLHQAAPGFRRWFGPLPVVDQALRDLVIADLGA